MAITPFAVALPLPVALPAGLVLAALSWWWVRHLPEPADAEPGKRPYRSLPTGWLMATLVVSALLAWASHHQQLGWAWLVWGSVGTVLVTVDLLTTYLPLRLHWAMTALLAVGIVLGTDQGTLAATVIGAALGAAVLGAGFWLLWRFSHSFGFGDVRLAFALGALTGSQGPSMWYASLLLGTLAGAVAAIAMVLRRRRHPSPEGTVFPYGPALWLGPWLALLLGQLR